MIRLISKCEKAKKDKRLYTGKLGGLYIIKKSKITNKKYRYYCHKIYSRYV